MSQALAGAHPRVLQFGLEAQNGREAYSHSRDFRRQLGDTPDLDRIYFMAGTIQRGIAEEQQGMKVLRRFLHLLRALGSGDRKPVYLVVLTDRLHPLSGGEPGSPFSALVVGLAKNALLEFPRLRIRCIDIDQSEPPDRIAAHIAAEPPSTDLAEVCIRSGRRYLRRYAPVETAASQRDDLFRHRGTYLIAGGTGGVGFETASFLAREHEARLILTGARALDEHKRACLRELEAMGSRALYLRADLADRAAMGKALAEAKRRFGTINGIFHAAGVLADRTLSQMDDEALTSVLAPKVRGSMILHELTRDEPLDFFVHYGSAVAAIGARGAGNYAAACRFQEALGDVLRARSPFPVKVISWGWWHQTGMGAREGLAEHMERRGIHALEKREAIASLKEVFARGLDECLVLVKGDVLLARHGLLAETGRTTPSSVTSDMLRSMHVWIDEHGGDPEHLCRGYNNAMHDLESYGAFFLLRWLMEAGLDFPCSCAELQQRLKVRDAYSAHFEALLALLVRRRLLQQTTHGFRPAEPYADRDRPAEALAAARTRAEARGDYAAHLCLLEACLAATPDVLTGERSAIEVLFPQGGFDMVEGIYSNNPFSDWLNTLLAELVGSCRELGEVGSEPGFRILEVGAGTGASSEKVLARLARESNDLRYDYTDISQVFVTHGRRVFSERYPFVRFATFDMSRVPDACKFLPQSRDLIFATNVLHGAEKLRPALENLFRLLVPGGVLILNELTRASGFHSMTFGLTDGWWQFRDADPRLPNAPLVDGRGWCDLLAEAGFEQIRYYGEGLRGEEPFQSLILAIRPRKSVAAEKAASAPDGRVEADRRDRLERVAEPSEEGNAARDGIAIIGISGRYPGSADIPSFWEDLVKGRCRMTPRPPHRGLSGEPAEAALQWGGFLSDEDAFDPLFFNIAPREAPRMDPQERLFLEAAWHCVEDAAYVFDPERERVGVFVGVMSSDYHLYVDNADGGGANLWSWHVANRVSHFFGFTGPSLALDTGCSASLTAVHLAGESLLRGECDLALAGGVKVLTHGAHASWYRRSGLLPPRGRCRAFSANADGIALGEGVGAVLLKPLSKALRDGDPIYAVIRGSAINAGRSAPGFLAPDERLQAEVIARAQREAGFAPRTITCLEAHGTGTPRGDRTELTALSRLFAGDTDDFRFCALGSVKTNIGHLEAAAGIASLTKVLLQFKHKTHVPSLNGSPGNPHFDFERLPFFIPEVAMPWDRPKIEGKIYPRRAGVSSFGAGGVNVHLILEEFEQPATAEDGGAEIIPFSAHKASRLEALLRRFLHDLEADGGRVSHTERAGLSDIACTLQTGRAAMAVRWAVIVSSKQELVEAIRAGLEGRSPDVPFFEGSEKSGPTMSIPERDRADQTLIRLARTWVGGGDIDWYRHRRGRGGHRLPLPGYPFEKNRYRLGETARLPTTMAGKSQVHDLGGGMENKLLPLIEDELIALLASLLDMNEVDIDPDKDLTQYGMDSLLLEQLAGALSDRYGLAISPVDLFEGASIRRHAQTLIDRHAAALTAYYGKGDELPARSEKLESRKPQAVHALGSAGEVHRTDPDSEGEAGAGDRLGKGEESAVAIIGMAGIFPGSPDVSHYWENLKQGKLLLSDIPVERFGDPGEGEKCWRGGFIEGIDRFDAAFFEISPREAAYMDPQQRLLLQAAWHTFEDAGYAPSSLGGSGTGVFVGAQIHEYEARLLAEPEGHLLTGNNHAVLANRISFLLNLHGPSEAINTACSSSLVAVHRAVRAIRGGECEMALAGGVNLMLERTTFTLMDKMGLLSPDFLCRAFDRDANGIVRGEGLGLVLLKPLTSAQRDGDNIYGLIRGTAVNHGGRAKSLTAPCPKAQAALLESAWRDSGLDPATLTYIETHGTGTTLGDPVELEGIRRAFANASKAWGRPSFKGSCGLGSVKTNIGHLEAAAGIAGLTKVVLALKHGIIPATLHRQQENPRLSLQDSPFFIVERTRPWHVPTDPHHGSLPRRAGVSSFGFGGSNAHVVLEAFAPAEPTPDSGPHAVVLSARTHDQLREVARRLVTFLTEEKSAPPPSVADIAHTLRVGRNAMSWRIALVVETREALTAGLEAYTRGEAKASGVLVGNGKPDRDLAAMLADSEETVRFFQSLFREGDLQRLLAFWVRGVPIPWERLYGDRPGRRMPLPGYPFADEPFWIGSQERATISGEPVASNEPEAPPAFAAGGSEAVADGLLATVHQTVMSVLGREITDDDLDAHLEQFGVDSVMMTLIQVELEQALGVELEPADLVEHVSILSLTRHLASSGAKVGGQSGETAAKSVPGPGSQGPRDQIESKPLFVEGTRLGPSARDGQDGEPIAIIGVSCRLPGAEHPDAYWQLLREGRHHIGPPPKRRLEEMWPQPPSTGLAGGYLDYIEDFDFAFFGFPSREARLMDPRQRILLELVQELLDYRGLSRDALSRNRTGTFIGASSTMCNDLEAAISLESRSVSPGLLGSEHYMLASRLGHVFDLKGPALCFDTACSSSLVAVHQACLALRAGDCDQAIAGGIHLALSTVFHVFFSKVGALSASGRVSPFDERADGLLLGEGGGLVLLKPLSRAEADGDPIHAVILGSAVNNDGRTMGVSTPDVAAQMKVLEDAWSDAGIDPGSLAYLESHGTGTVLGDAIELKALTQAFRRHSEKQQFCALGSVKANIGHLLQAAGIAGLIKVVLSLQGRFLPPMHHCEQPKAHFEIDSSPFYIPREGRFWPEGDSPRRAGVSAFGFSGTNCHVVLEQGNKIPSSGLQPVTTFQRVTLPWPPLRSEAPESKHLVRPSADDADQRRVFYLEPVWEPIPDREMLARGETGPLLLLSRNLQLADLLAAELGTAGTQPIIQATPGPTYAQTKASTYVFDPTSEKDLSCLWLDLERQGLWPKTVVHAWLFEAEPWPASPHAWPAHLDRLLDEGALASLRIIASMTTRSQTRVRHIYPYAAREDSLHALDAMIAGLGHSLASTGKGVVLQALELDKMEVGCLASALAGEIACQPGGEIEISRSGKGPLGKRFRPITTLPPPLLLQDHDVYLITGGAGGLGLLAARFLAERGPCKLVLMGRRQLGDTQREKIEDLRRGGAEVIYTRGDVTRWEDLEKVMATIRNRFGSLDCIIHAAGVNGTNVAEHSTKAVLAPKVLGTLFLDEISREMPLKFLVTFSSLASVVGHIARPDYALANRFMDELMAWRHRMSEAGRRSGKSLSINWPYWEDSGTSVSPTVREQYRQRGIGVLDRKTGFDALAFCLAFEGSQVLVVEGEPQAVAQRFGFSVSATPEEEPSLSRTCNRADAENAESEPRPADIEARIRALLEEDIAEQLPDRAEIREGAGFMELGLDSLQLIDLAEGLEQKTGTMVYPTVFYEYPSITELSRHLAEHYGEAFSRALDDRQAGALTGREDDGEDPEQIVKSGQPADDTTPLAFTEEQRSDERGVEPIAVIGMSGRFPGSPDLRRFWRNLAAGKDLITTVPDQRWRGHPEADRAGAAGKWGGFLEDVDGFDPLFFAISPLEASHMDPQQRLFLETAWQAIEDAGYPPSGLAATDTGVFTGYGYQEYLERFSENDNPLLAIGNLPTMLANRVSYQLDLRGPSETLNTACSSSLVAVHRAVCAIRAGECAQALAGGVHLNLSPRGAIRAGRSGMLAPDGRCKTFCKEADGFVRADAVGVVLLKPLARAREDGDLIYGVILGSAVNHDGHGSGLTAPNPRAQAEVIAAAWDRTGVDPAAITYMETHGTGTVLGDPAETAGLRRGLHMLSKGRELPPGSCGLGSVKTNMGHAESAAGIAGLIKVLLAFHHRMLPATIHRGSPNPHLNLEDSPFYVVSETTTWHPDEHNTPLRAGVSSFGLGGSNAHLALEEYRLISRASETRPAGPFLFVLSAGDRAALFRYASMMIHFLENDSDDVYPADFAYSLQIGREALPERLAVLGETLNDFAAQLHHFLKGERSENLFHDPGDRAEEATTGPVAEPISTRALKGIAACWVRGESVDWQRLYPGKKPLRVKLLPPYPFATEPCWLTHDPPDTCEPADSSTPQRAVAAYLEATHDPCFHYAHRISEGLALLDEAATLRLTDLLVRMGSLSDPEATFTDRDFAVSLGARPQFAGLLAAMLTILEKEGLLHRRGQIFEVTRRLEEPPYDRLEGAIQTSRDRLERVAPFLCRHLDVLETCLAASREMLSGKKLPVEILFPNGSSSVLQAIYQDNPLADYFHMLTSGAIAAHVRQRRTSRPGSQIRILEVGAGIGGTTAAVLARLAVEGVDPGNLNYVYTDVSPHLIAHGRDRFDETYPFLDFKTLDLDQDPADQGFAKDTYDIVLGANVLHAVKHLDHTLGYLRELLREDGMLVLEEATAHHDYLTLIFGFLPGWWQCEDTASRLPNGPLLDVPLWQSCLAEQGFDHFGSYGAMGETSAPVGQHLMIAFKPDSDRSATSSDTVTSISDEENRAAESMPTRPLAAAEPVILPPDLYAVHQQWTCCDIPVVAEQDRLDGPVLLFCHDAEPAEGNSDMVLIKPGDRFEARTDDFLLRPDCAEDYGLLLDNLAVSNGGGLRVIHLWNATARELGEMAGPEYLMRNIETGLPTGLYSVYHLTRALLARKVTADIAFFFNEVNSQAPHHAALSAFAETLHRESYHLFCKVIAIADPTLTTRDLLAVGSAEVVVRDKATIRYDRQGRRVLRMHAQPFERKYPAAEPVISRGGTWLITGGTGGLGLIFAEYLARSCRANLVLVGRSPLDAAKRESLSRLERLGAKAIYYPADVAHLADLEEVVSRARQRFGHLDGVLHGAGISPGAMIPNLEPEVMGKTLKSKLFGALNLDIATAGEPLEAFVMHSSISGYQGAIGSAAYATANRFMDAFAQLREQWVEAGKRVGKTLAVGWSFWKQGGMKKWWDEEGLGLISLESAWGLEIFRRLLAGPDHQVGVLMGKRKDLEKLWTLEPCQPRNGSDPTPSSGESPPPTRLTRERVQQEVSEAVSRALGLDPQRLDPETDFERLGMSSLIILDVLDELEHRLGMAIEPMALIDHPNVRLLSAHLIERGLVSLVEPADSSEPSAAVVAAAEPGREPAETRDVQPIAVICTACRFPGAADPEQFWENLKAGVCSIRELSAGGEHVPDRRQAGRPPLGSHAKRMAALEGIDLFDADFFGCSTDEALTMDPQQRIMLELVQQLWDRAGYPKDELAGSATGIFLGASDSNYRSLFNAKATDRKNPSRAARWFTDHAPYMIARHMAHFYDLRGPCRTIDTACSSSLVAIHDACNSLRSGEVDMAVAGGLSLWIGPEMSDYFHAAGALSETGVGRVFDRRADGIVLGEGAGLVLLKTLAAAKRDGDRIDALIRGSAVNQDGHTMGRTTPNGQAQQSVIQRALDQAKIRATQLIYLESHGTGTLLGDPIEIGAAARVFENARARSCALGSVKANIGHLLLAAGVAGFIKVLHILRHRVIPPQISCEEPHPRFGFEESPFTIDRKPRAWRMHDDKRFAGVSAFGFSGTNCHMVLEAFEEAEHGHQTLKKPLPPTEFRRKSYWPGTAAAKNGNPLDSPLLDRYEVSAGAHIYHKELGGDLFFLKDHMLANRPLCPGVFFLVLIREACALGGLHTDLCRIERLRWRSPLFLDNLPLTLSLAMIPKGASMGCEVYTEVEGEKTLLAGAFLPSLTPLEASDSKADLPSPRTRESRILDQGKFYEAYHRLTPLTLGQSLRVVSKLAVCGDEVVARLVRPAMLDDGDWLVAALYGAIQSCLGFFLDRADAPYLPLSLGSVRWYRRLADDCEVRVIRGSGKPIDRAVVFDILISDHDGLPLIKLESVCFRMLDREAAFDPPEHRSRQDEPDKNMMRIIDRFKDGALALDDAGDLIGAQLRLLIET
ncbi:MAG: SDR family NAD(P)-dependent oxidoreductase [Acidobacteriota bacterium]|nr:SDR family NAD(P)-dependent oxidoreductase [Acidobacteriota bacterium]